MEENTSIPMENTAKIMRKSIHIFLRNYQYFTATAALMAFPFSATVLLSQIVVPSSSLLFSIQNRLSSVFIAAGFPPSSEFFTVLNLKLSQTISTSIFTLPFTFTSLLIAKASIIQLLDQQKQNYPVSFLSLISIFNPIFLTQLCNSFLIISANATAFSILLVAFNCFEGLGYSSPGFILFISALGAVIYSIILANAFVFSNLALISSGMERNGGFLAILKACVLMRGRTSTALSLAVPLNLAMALIEGLFQYRVIRAYHRSGNLSSLMVLEGLFIAYMYSIVIVVDTIVSCVFFKRCYLRSGMDYELGRCSYQIETEEDRCAVMNTKGSEESS